MSAMSLEFRGITYGFGMSNGVQSVDFSGDSKSSVTLYLNSENEQIEIGQTVLDFKEEATIPLIDIEYVDLRCDFYAISVTEHWLRYPFERAPKPKPRHVFFLNKDYQLDEKALGSLYGNDESIDSIEMDAMPPYLNNKKMKWLFLDTESGNDPLRLQWHDTAYFVLWYRIVNQPTHELTHLRTSCAYSATTGNIVYHVKGGYSGTEPLDGYVGTFNGETQKWVEFETANKSEFITNHQIAFYYLDLG